jgi:hypothetical protein
MKPVEGEGAAGRGGADAEPARPSPAAGMVDPGLRRLMKWVLAALILTVLFALLVVELTLRWFKP